MEIVVEFPGGKKVQAKVGPFTVSTDQPSENDPGTAPSPYLVFLASLATCAGHYARSYLENHGLPWQGMKLVQSHRFDEKSGKLAAVEVKLIFPPGLDQKHRQAAARAAANCAVKKTIENPPSFSVTTD